MNESFGSLGLVVMAALAAALGDQELALARGTETRFAVPSAEYRTIQEAIDRVPDGATLDIAPGVYRENLSIAGKRLRIAGASGPGPRTEIVAADEARAVIAYGSGGGGALQDLALRGGTFGVLAEAGSRTGGDVELTIRRLTIRQTGSGVYGRFSKLELEDSRIVATESHSVVLLFCGVYCSVKDAFVSNAGGAGLYVANEAAGGAVCDPETGASLCIHDSAFVANEGGGIMIIGGAKPVSIRHSWALANRFGGILLWGGSDVTIDETEASGSLPLDDGRFGDGIVAVLTPNLVVTDSITDSNARSGVAAFGSTIGLGGNWSVCNAFDMNYETFAGIPGNFVKLADNTCGCVGDPCQALSSGLEAPPALP